MTGPEHGDYEAESVTGKKQTKTAIKVGRDKTSREERFGKEEATGWDDFKSAAVDQQQNTKMQNRRQWVSWPLIKNKWNLK